MTVHTQKQSYTLTIRGDHNFANIFGLNDDIDPLTPSGINVDVYTSNVIVWSSRLLQAHGFAVGAFESNGSARTLADVTGTISRIEIVPNDEPNPEPAITKSWEIPVPLAFFNVWDADLPGDDFFQGSDGVNVLQGMGGDDRFKGLSDGSVDEGAGLVQGDWFYGGDGLDTSIYQGKISEYTITSSAASTDRVDIYDLRLDDGTRVPGFYVEDLVVRRDGNDRLAEVERLEFETPEANGANRIALDIDGNAGQAYRLYKAAFNRSPDTAGLGYWIANLDQGMSLRLVSTAFIGSAEFQALYGVDTSDSELIELLYNNVLSRDPDADGLDYWQGQLTAGLSHADLLVNFSESNENQENVIALIGNGIAYEQWMG